MADGMSFRGCLSGGGDIFSKSVEKQGGANRTFATGGRCHGWQLEPCPCGLEPLLTFRQKIPTGRPYIEEGHSIRQRHNLQHRDSRNQRKGQKKSPFLLFVQGFAELCEDAHEAQHKKVNGRQDIKITVHCKTFHLWISVIKARICYSSISRCSVFLNQTPRSFTFSRPKAPECFIGGFASVAPVGTGHRPLQYVRCSGTYRPG